MSSYVFKPCRTVGGKAVRAKSYSGRYRLVGEPRAVQVALKVTDKQVAQSKLAGIVKQAEMERQGLAAPRRQVETVSLPLKSVVREWVADLNAKGRKPHYCGIMDKFMGVLMRGCHWSKVADISPDSFILWRGINSSKAPKTLNEYLGCARAFLTWLVKSGRLPANPLASVEKVETRGREVRNRRSLTHDEFLRLLAVAGPVRSVVYAVAYYTGLRRAELASLCWADFCLSGENPSVTIRAKHAKNKTSVTIPLHADLREMLEAHFVECGSPELSAKALEVPPRLHAFNADLKAAGIVQRNAEGRVLDFHCLRHSCATRLASANVPLPVSMVIMRHSDPKLTAKAYVDQAALPVAQSIAQLPGMKPPVDNSPIDSPKSGAEGHFGSQPVATNPPDSKSQLQLNESLRHVLTRLVASWQMAPAVGIEPTT